MENYDFTIIGAGIVGAATAYKLQLKYPDAKVLVLEKESHEAFHQTGRNSGVLHSGLYYKPGSFKAKNCVEGREALVEFAKAEGIQHEVCGKLVAAKNEAEVKALPSLVARGIENGLSGIKELDSKEAKEVEPFIQSKKALFIPQTGIIDFKAVTKRLLEKVLEINPHSEIRFEEEVIGIDGDKVKLITTKTSNIQSKFLVVCGGLFSDRLAKLDGLKPDLRIVGFRGDYYELTEDARHKIKNLVYPVPNPAFPFLGVHFTRMTSGEVECGPNAVFTFKREGYSKTDFSYRDTVDALGFSGTRKLFKKHWKYGLMEYRRAFSKKRFLKELQGLMPSLKDSEIKQARSGVRAMALRPDGEMHDDFDFAEGPSSLHVINAPSPAATACLSIADEIVKRVSASLS